MEAAAPAPDSGLELGGNTTASISTRWGVLATTGPTTLHTTGQHSDTVAATTRTHAERCWPGDAPPQCVFRILAHIFINQVVVLFVP